MIDLVSSPKQHLRKHMQHSTLLQKVNGSMYLFLQMQVMFENPGNAGPEGSCIDIAKGVVYKL